MLEHFLATVERLSNQAYQERVWVKAEGLEWGDADEFICRFFDFGEFMFEHPEEYELSAFQYRIVMRLVEQMDQFTGLDQSTPEMLDTLGWQDVRARAREVLYAFKYEPTLPELEKRRLCLLEYLKHIAHIADENYQERVWVRREGPESESFEKGTRDFFSRGESILKNYKDFCISDVQQTWLVKFNGALREFAEVHCSPAQFMGTQEWKDLRKMAKKVLKIFECRRTFPVLVNEYNCD